MILFKNTIKFLLFFLLLNTTSCNTKYPELEEGIYAEFITTKGIMVAKLNYKKAPITVSNFVSLAEGTNTAVSPKYKEKKYYNNLLFYRVINEFMIQSGAPTNSGKGNPGYRFTDEFHPDLKHNKPGILSMANPKANSNGSQFFITEVAKPHLDNTHSVFGELVIGLNILDSISNTKVDKKNRPLKDIVIKKLNILRIGKNALQFNAPKIFKNHFAQIERLKQEKKDKAEAIIKTSKATFDLQKIKAITLNSGLKYFISKKGTGIKLKEGNKVLTNYTVFFENGKLLETTKLDIAKKFDAVNKKRQDANRYQAIEAQISPNANMISGFKEGLKKLSVGDKATLFIPYHLAYGEYGTPNIPEKTNLIFEVEIIKLLN